MSESAGPIIEVERVSFRYAGSDAPALENVSISVRAGERLGILGPNGGGKSTLLRLILGLIEPTSGTVRVCGFSPSDARARGLIGYVPQRPEVELGMPLSAWEAVELAVLWRRPPWRGLTREERAELERILSLVGASTFANRPIGKLSGGQVQRVLIARALACRPRILALDEPMVGIDAAGQRTFADLLSVVHREFGLTILTVTHDLRAIAAASDRVACLARRLHSHGSPRGLTPAILAELFSHDIAGLSGVLEGMHIHAHASGEACPSDSVSGVEQPGGRIPPGCDQKEGHAHS